MLRVLRQDRVPLVAFLLAALLGSPGCSTGEDPPEELEGDSVEVSDANLFEDENFGDFENSEENFEFEEGALNLENFDSEGLSDDGQYSNFEDENFENFENENLFSENENLEEPQAVPEQIVTMDQDTFVGGKAGVPIQYGLPEAGSKMAYIVKKGDTLSKIALKIFQEMDRWRELAEASSIANPNLIYPGDVVYYQLDMTSVAFAKQYENVPMEEIQVKGGDTLSSLSQDIYGDQEQWKFLWRLNSHIKDPHKIQIGSIIKYPTPEALKKLSQDGYTVPFVKAEAKKVYSQKVKQRVLT